MSKLWDDHDRALATERLEKVEKELAELKQAFYDFRRQASRVVMMHTPLG